MKAPQVLVPRWRCHAKLHINIKLLWVSWISGLERWNKLLDCWNTGILELPLTLLHMRNIWIVHYNYNCRHCWLEKLSLTKHNAAACTPLCSAKVFSSTDLNTISCQCKLAYSCTVGNFKLLYLISLVRQCHKSYINLLATSTTIIIISNEHTVRR